MKNIHPNESYSVILESYKLRRRAKMTGIVVQDHEVRVWGKRPCLIENIPKVDQNTPNIDQMPQRHTLLVLFYRLRSMNCDFVC